MANRDNADPSGLGCTPGWALRGRKTVVLYNRASVDPQGQPWDAKRQLIKWNGNQWIGPDVPDYSNAAPNSGVGPLLCNQRVWDAYLLLING